MELVQREDARKAGLTRYFTGKPCLQGHISERMVSTRACLACLRAFTKRWRAARPEQMNAQKRAYRTANLEKVKAWKSADQKKHRASANARNRKWRAENLAQARTASARWQMENPGKANAKAARRRAAELRAMPPWADQSKIARAYELCAEYRAKGIDCHVDHIIPLQGKRVCGLHVQGNFQILGREANQSKSNRF